MTSDAAGPPRRRRRRASAPQGAAREAAPEPEQAVEAPAPPARKARKPPAGTGRPKTDRGLHDLVGGGSSQLGTSRALRARDVNRPTDDDLAAAERDLTVVKRNWRPL